MNRRRLLASVAAAVLSAAVGMAAAHTTAAAEPPFPLPAPNPLAAGASHAVSIGNMLFGPAAVSVNVGDTVVWTNNDDRDHTVVADDGSFKSDNLGHGATFRHTFTKAGKIKYSCTYHPRMKGTVTVGG